MGKSAKSKPRKPPAQPVAAEPPPPAPVSPAPRVKISPPPPKTPDAPAWMVWLGLDWMDAACLGVLAALVWYFLDKSWRKWPDPQVDFGREVYIPWMLTQGKVLYRDIDHLYGPFSQYFNSVVFRVLGVGLTSLIEVNLVIYAAIFGLLYYLTRAGWGRWAATVACAVFIGVFSFSHLVGIGNYNFVTPYAHEVTHGILVGLLLVAVWWSLLKRVTRWKVVGAGALAGLSVLIKPEAMLTAGLVTFGGVFLLWRRQGRGLFTKAWGREARWFLLGAATPVLLATVLLVTGAGFSWPEAWRNANNAWIGVLDHSNIGHEPLQKWDLGTDHLGDNIFNEFVWGGLTLALGAGVALVCRFLAKDRDPVKWFVLVVLAGIGLDFAWDIQWMNIAVALPGLLGLALFYEWKRMARSDAATATDGAAAARVLLWLAAVSLLARMAFLPKVFHYGFYQAALAAMVGVAALLVAVPEFFRLETLPRRAYQAVMTALIVLGVAQIASHSLAIEAAQTQPVGTGDDQFFAIQGEPSGMIIAALRKFFTEQDKGAHSLMVLPDGVMLNYLARLPSTVPQFMFFPALLEGGREEITLAKLKAAPPDRIVLLARNEEEVGAHQFGDQVGHGQLILQFIEQNYNRIGTLGGAPLPYDPSHPGAWVFALKPPGTPAAAAAPAATPPATNTAPANPPPTPPPAP